MLTSTRTTHPTRGTAPTTPSRPAAWAKPRVRSIWPRSASVCFPGNHRVPTNNRTAAPITQPDDARQTRQRERGDRRVAHPGQRLRHLRGGDDQARLQRRRRVVLDVFERRGPQAQRANHPLLETRHAPPALRARGIVRGTRQLPAARYTGAHGRHPGFTAAILGTIDDPHGLSTRLPGLLQPGGDRRPRADRRHRRQPRWRRPPRATSAARSAGSIGASTARNALLHPAVRTGRKGHATSSA